MLIDWSEGRNVSARRDKGASGIIFLILKLDSASRIMVVHKDGMYCTQSRTGCTPTVFPYGLLELVAYSMSFRP